MTRLNYTKVIDVLRARVLAFASRAYNIGNEAPLSAIFIYLEGEVFREVDRWISKWVR